MLSWCDVAGVWLCLRLSLPAAVAQSSISLWLASVLHNPAVLSRLLMTAVGWEGGVAVPTIFRSLLLCRNSVIIRRETSNAIFHLCSHINVAELPAGSPAPATYFEDMLLEALKEIADPDGNFVPRVAVVSRLASLWMCGDPNAVRRSSVRLWQLPQLLQLVESRATADDGREQARVLARGPAAACASFTATVRRYRVPTRALCTACGHR